MTGFDPKTMEVGVRFLGSFDDSPPDLQLPEVAFVGRSNVGKSSLLNSLLNKKIAVTSKTPGRTQRINLFAVKDKQSKVFCVADLPGWGFARISKGGQRAIEGFLRNYLEERKQLQLVVLLVDPRLEPQEADMEAMALLEQVGRPFLVVATKADKLRPRELAEHLDRYEQLSGLEPGQVIAYSSLSGEGRALLYKVVRDGVLGLSRPDADVSDADAADADAEEGGGADGEYPDEGADDMD